MNSSNTFFKVVFQFHSGSIQTATRARTAGAFSWFQFHSGSIQTNEEELARIRAAMFQFHSGSIQTRNEPMRLSD